MLNSISYGFKKFKHDLDLVRRESINFSYSLHLELWFKDYLLKKSPLDAGFPWINYCVIQFLHHSIDRKMRVLEFGAGGSSIFFLKKGVELFSIEHEKIWISEVKERISPVQFSKWSPHLVLSRNQETNIPNPEDYLSPIKKIKKASLDIVLIDGRHRVESIKQSMPLIKDGGILILDNSDRSDYQEAFTLLTDWSLLNTSCITNASDFVTPAAIWTKSSF